ncbi:MAG: hypothetical protein QG597_742 [Actinomycetota bacterium]|nr:hypothetical protein [Actinomycetota bacterium]
MAMKFYADTPTRKTRQILSDVWFVFWCALWVWVAVRLHNLIVPLGAPGEQLAGAGDSLSQNMTEAGDAVDGLPFIGDRVRDPFDRMSEAGQSLADAGRGQQEVVDKLALFLPLALAFLAIALLAVVWLPLRIRFISRATAAQRYLVAADDVDLFALRALARQPLSQLVAIDADPAGAWRRGDPVVIRSLAALELRGEGLRIPGITDDYA